MARTQTVNKNDEQNRRIRVEEVEGKVGEKVKQFVEEVKETEIGDSEDDDEIKILGRRN